MARPAAAFKQSDISRAIKGAREGGLDVTGVEIRQVGNGVSIVIMTGSEKPIAPVEELDLNV